MFLPNPDTTLAYLPPAVANELQVTGYVYVASLGVSASAVQHTDLQQLILDV